MSVIASEADVEWRPLNVRFGPQADINEGGKERARNRWYPRICPIIASLEKDAAAIFDAKICLRAV